MKTICIVAEITPIGMNQGFQVKFDTGRTVESSVEFGNALNSVLPELIKKLDEKPEKKSEK